MFCTIHYWWQSLREQKLPPFNSSKDLSWSMSKFFTCVLIPTRILTILKYYKWMTRGRTQFNTQVSLSIANSFCKLLQDTKNECGLFQVPLFSSARQRNRSKKLEFYTFLLFDSHASKTLSDWWDNQFTIANQTICSSEDKTKSNTCFSSVLFK